MYFTATGILTLSLSILPVFACGDEHAHVHQRRGYPSAELPVPSRPLQWGDINILHTTDTHGWLLGHQKTSFPEPNYRWVSLSSDICDIRLIVLLTVETWETLLPSLLT